MTPSCYEKHRLCNVIHPKIVTYNHDHELEHVYTYKLTNNNCKVKIIRFNNYLCTHFPDDKMKSSRTGRGQLFEAEVRAEDKSSRPRPRLRTKFWPRGQLGLEDLTSLINKPEVRHLSTSGIFDLLT